MMMIMMMIILIDNNNDDDNDVHGGDGWNAGVSDNCILSKI